MNDRDAIERFDRAVVESFRFLEEMGFRRKALEKVDFEDPRYGRLEIRRPVGFRESTELQPRQALNCCMRAERLKRSATAVCRRIQNGGKAPRHRIRWPAPTTAE